jgi:two-component system OmpR family sensor kinase
VVTLSLRARLLLGVIVLSAIGLITVDVLVYTSLRSFLYQQADKSLDTTAASLTSALAEPTVSLAAVASPGASAESAITPLSVTGACVALRTLSGGPPVPANPAIGSQCLSSVPQAILLPPRLPDTIDVPATPGPDGQRVSYFNAPATTGSTAIAITDPDPSQSAPPGSLAFPGNLVKGTHVSGAGILDGTTITSGAGTGTLILSTVSSSQSEPVDLGFWKEVKRARITKGSETVTVPARLAAIVAPRMYVEGPGIPNPDTLVTGTTPAASTLPGARSSFTLSKPATASGYQTLTFSTDVPNVVTVAGSPSNDFRVRASVAAADPKFMLVIASPLSSVQHTLHRLLVLELVLTAAVLAGLVALGLWVVNVGLRPLREIEATAVAIADGDLSRRIERVDERTEVGRLSAVLNSMLAQIEAAFRAREGTEQKLRRFVADASHELRTPLAAVRAYAELFSRGAARRPDDLERSMEGIERETERMSVLVDELILLAHLDDGRTLRRDPVDLESVVADSVETARTVEPDRPIDMETVPAIVSGDRDRLRQLVDNLLANVRAHTPAGAPARVVLRADGGNAVLEVSDTGPGMRPDELAHVFERFFRTDRSRARASGGSGLGLAIVTAVADAHGGTATASSVQGTGSTFTVTIPLAPAAVGQENGAGPAGDSQEPAVPAARGAD